MDFNVPIDVLNLDPKYVEILKNNQIETVADLYRIENVSSLLKIRGINHYVAHRIYSELNAYIQRPSIEELETKLGTKLLPLTDAARKVMKMAVKHLKTFVDNGVLDWCEGLIYRIPEDAYSIKHFSKVFFHERKLKEIAKRFKSIRQVVDELKMGHDSFLRWLDRGYFGDVRVLRTEGYKVHLVDAHAIYANLEEAKRKASQNQKAKEVVRTIDYKGNLPQEVLDLVDGYIRHRNSVIPTIIIGGIPVVKQGFTSKKIGEFHRHKLYMAFFRIIAAQGGITNLLRDVLSDLARDLDEHEWEMYQQAKEKFLLRRLSINDFMLLGEATNRLYLTDTVHRYIKPCLQYFLMVEEQTLRNNKIEEAWTKERKIEEMEKLDDLKTNILTAINQVTSLPSKNNNAFADPDEKKVFLSREKYARLYQTTLQKKGVKNALKLAFSWELGLRLEEAMLVAVEDFWIDENGFLLTDEDGYGLLFLPDEKSKTIGSHKKYGNQVPPQLVKTINHYLKNHLYKKCPFEKHKEFKGYKVEKHGSVKVYKDGHGYFFRNSKYEDVPSAKYASNGGLGSFLRDFRSTLSFLSEEERNNISYHDGRHTLNEWMETARVDDDLSDYRDEAADIQMRHSFSIKDVGKKHYRQRITFEQFRKIYDSSVDFPKDVKILREWEIHHGYRVEELSDDEVVKPSLSVEKKKILPKISEAERIRLENEIEELNKKLMQTTHIPNGENPWTWLEQRKKWNLELKQKKALLSKAN
jgi:hypothetical protein